MEQSKHDPAEPIRRAVDDMAALIAVWTKAGDTPAALATLTDALATADRALVELQSLQTWLVTELRDQRRRQARAAVDRRWERPGLVR